MVPTPNHKCLRVEGLLGFRIFQGLGFRALGLASRYLEQLTLRVQGHR